MARRSFVRSHSVLSCMLGEILPRGAPGRGQVAVLRSTAATRPLDSAARGVLWRSSGAYCLKYARSQPVDAVMWRTIARRLSTPRTSTGSALRAAALKSLEVVAERGAFAEAAATVKELEGRLSDDAVWEGDAAPGPMLARQLAELSAEVAEYERLKTTLEDATELLELAQLERDHDVEEECVEELARIARDARKLELAALLDGEMDALPALVEVSAGAGGDEACDWVRMLERMLTRWAQSRDFSVQVLERQEGDVLGSRNVVLRFEGSKAYGWLRTEAGVHRLVRISPTDTASRRHTSFATVVVLPDVDAHRGGISSQLEAELHPDNIKIETFKSSGAGGQHVNTTDSAVRVTHVPTGITANCQAQRSQHSNKEAALSLLRAKVAARLEELRQRELKGYSEGLGDSWGSQIRSYVLHPYTSVKDHRTGITRGDAQAVLDGDLDEFVEAALAAPSQ